MNEKKNLPNHHEMKREEEMASRRQFLKKAAYNAPMLVSLGYLLHSSNANAGGSTALDDDPEYGTPDDGWDPWA